MKIIPEKDLADILLRVENPGRYTGGEYGIVKKEDPIFRIALCFPDLYELGMSNQAMAILYGMLNAIEGVSCERVFCPAKDFEIELKKKSIPLYGLECGTPLNQFDLIAFSIGYELSATNVLSVLSCGNIPVLAKERSSFDPIVIAGGPAITNPVPFGDFLDAAYIGEGEAEFLHLIDALCNAKKKKSSRDYILDCIKNSTFFWYKGKLRPTLRSIWSEFSYGMRVDAGFPVPNIRTTQDRGVVEIMRGCPHGCRFCHAGIYYRPFRMKKTEVICDEVWNLVHKYGYREITLSSLSSGDYKGISELVGYLNGKYEKDYVSFSLPSLHIDSFALQILGKLSEVRKSGLTFAVETPRDEYQKGLNKIIFREKIESIAREAKSLGWKSAKFYFMVGLPFSYQDEAEEISEYIEYIYKSTHLQMNINIGTFIPKPHTPYQWEGQLTETESIERVLKIKNNLKRLPVKIGYHAPFQSFLEGIISRGDERAGNLILQAYKNGAGFDAWEDKLQKDVWKKVVREADWDVESFTCGKRPMDSDLPWNSIRMGVKEDYFKDEKIKSEGSLSTQECSENCYRCGVCGSDVSAVTDTSTPIDEPTINCAENPEIPQEKIRTVYRYIFHYQKTGKAVYIPHLGFMQMMERSILRAGIHVRFTEGFNPKPVLEFAQPLSLGVASRDEIFSFDSWEKKELTNIISKINDCLPEGVYLFEGGTVLFKEGEKKPESLMSLYTGGQYELVFFHESGKMIFMENIKNNSSITVLEVEDLTVRLNHLSNNSKGLVSLIKGYYAEPYFEHVRVCKVRTFLKE
jgi:radical SAM-linked protein